MLETLEEIGKLKTAIRVFKEAVATSNEIHKNLSDLLKVARSFIDYFNPKARALMSPEERKQTELIAGKKALTYLQLPDKQLLALLNLLIEMQVSILDNLDSSDLNEVIFNAVEAHYREVERFYFEKKEDVPLPKATRARIEAYLKAFPLDKILALENLNNSEAKQTLLSCVSVYYRALADYDCNELKNYEVAIPTYKQAVEILIRLINTKPQIHYFSNKVEYLLGCYFNLAACYDELKNYPEVDKYLRLYTEVYDQYKLDIPEKNRAILEKTFETLKIQISEGKAKYIKTQEQIQASKGNAISKDGKMEIDSDAEQEKANSNDENTSIEENLEIQQILASSNQPQINNEMEAESNMQIEEAIVSIPAADPDYRHVNFDNQNLGILIESPAIEEFETAKKANLFSLPPLKRLMRLTSLTNENLQKIQEISKQTIKLDDKNSYQFNNIEVADNEDKQLFVAAEKRFNQAINLIKRLNCYNYLIEFPTILNHLKMVFNICQSLVAKDPANIKAHKDNAHFCALMIAYVSNKIIDFVLKNGSRRKWNFKDSTCELIGSRIQGTKEIAMLTEDFDTIREPRKRNEHGKEVKVKIYKDYKIIGCPETSRNALEYEEKSYEAEYASQTTYLDALTKNPISIELQNKKNAKKLEVKILDKQLFVHENMLAKIFCEVLTPQQVEKFIDQFISYVNINYHNVNQDDSLPQKTAISLLSFFSEGIDKKTPKEREIVFKRYQKANAAFQKARTEKNKKELYFVEALSAIGEYYPDVNSDKKDKTNDVTTQNLFNSQANKGSNQPSETSKPKKRRTTNANDEDRMFLSEAVGELGKENAKRIRHTSNNTSTAVTQTPTIGKA